MSRFRFRLPAPTSGTEAIVRRFAPDPRLQLPATLSPDAQGRWLDSITITNRGGNLLVVLINFAASRTGADATANMTNGWLVNPEGLGFEQEGRSILIGGPNAPGNQSMDTSDPYFYVASRTNSAALRAFFFTLWDAGEPASILMDDGIERPSDGESWNALVSTATRTLRERLLPAAGTRSRIQLPAGVRLSFQVRLGRQDAKVDLDRLPTVGYWFASVEHPVGTLRVASRRVTITSEPLYRDPTTGTALRCIGRTSSAWDRDPRAPDAWARDYALEIIAPT